MRITRICRNCASILRTAPNLQESCQLWSTCKIHASFDSCARNVPTAPKMQVFCASHGIRQLACPSGGQRQVSCASAGSPASYLPIGGLTCKLPAHRRAHLQATCPSRGKARNLHMQVRNLCKLEIYAS
jgi:hypothetical protein